MSHTGKVPVSGIYGICEHDHVPMTEEWLYPPPPPPPSPLPPFRFMVTDGKPVKLTWGDRSEACKVDVGGQIRSL